MATRSAALQCTEQAREKAFLERHTSFNSTGTVASFPCCRNARQDSFCKLLPIGSSKALAHRLMHILEHSATASGRRLARATRRRVGIMMLTRCCGSTREGRDRVFFQSLSFALIFYLQSDLSLLINNN